jgi:dipeptidyl aminopeptidase/acylaminoacyl peptidase
MRLHKLLLFISGFLLSSSLLSAQDNDNDIVPIDYLDVFDMQYITEPAISPDGEKVAYIRNHFDIMTDRQYTNVWLIGSDGNDHRALTSGNHNRSNLAWAPDGRSVAFVSNVEETSQIFVYDIEHGTKHSITSLERSPSALSWSPDGNWITFQKGIPADSPQLGNIPSPPNGAEWAEPSTLIDFPVYKADGAGIIGQSFTQLFLVAPDGGAVRQLTDNTFNNTHAAWAPDSRSLVFNSNRSENAPLEPLNTHIIEINIDSGEEVKLTDGQGPHSEPKISPDGTTIAFTGFDDQFKGYQLTRLFLMDRDGTNIREIDTGLDHDIGNVKWSDDGNGLFFQYNHHGVGHIGFTDMNGSATVIADNVGGTVWGLPWLPFNGNYYSLADNNRIAFALTSPYHPADVAVADTQNSQNFTRLTNLNETLFSTRTLGKVEEVWYSSSYDNRDVHGWVVYPPDFDPDQRYPLLMEIHGGPHIDYGARFSAEMQLKAAKGYVVIYTNPRGSTSYGPEFASYINFAYPGHDYDDLMSGIDHMLERNYIDPDQLFITGGSGGGLLTAWSIGKTDRFRAAVITKPVINWYSFVLTADAYPRFSQYWFTEMPWDDPMQHMERSPISLVGNVTTPTMLLTGVDDQRTPMGETEQYYQALQLQGVESMLIRVPGASHFISARPSNLIRKVGYIVGWFDRYREQE